MTAHVLVIGIDGVRYDTLGEVATPHLDALAARGTSAPLRVNDAGPTISGPSWATILTGVLATDHGILDNNLSPHHLDQHPDVIELARRQRPELATFVAAGWLPLVTTDSGGPLITGGGWHPDRPQAHSHDEWQEVDQAVTDASVAFLTAHDGTHDSLVFTYLGGVDETGHRAGVGPEYRGFIEHSDLRVGQLVSAITTRPATEEWTVIAVTDHGHLDRGGHGGDSELERTAWITASGPSVPVLPASAPDRARAGRRRGARRGGPRPPADLGGLRGPAHRHPIG